jgi:hypothetical protein
LLNDSAGHQYQHYPSSNIGLNLNAAPCLRNNLANDGSLANHWPNSQSVAGSENYLGTSSGILKNAKYSTNVVPSGWSNSYQHNLASNANFGPAFGSDKHLATSLANGLNINTGKFAANDFGLATKVFGDTPCGIQFSTDGLTVDGSVNVRGKMPFHSTVSITGQLPTVGNGLTECGCYDEA